MNGRYGAGKGGGIQTDTNRHKQLQIDRKGYKQTQTDTNSSEKLEKEGFSITSFLKTPAY